MSWLSVLWWLSLSTAVLSSGLGLLLVVAGSEREQEMGLAILVAGALVLPFLLLCRIQEDKELVALRRRLKEAELKLKQQELRDTQLQLTKRLNEGGRDE